MRDPEICVVVASHRRPARLAKLLDALAAQSLPRERWGTIVVHDDGEGETSELLRTHRLAESGTLRSFEFPEGTGSAAAMRNLGWRRSGSALIAFTDDDCRPPPEWLGRLLAAARAHAGAIVQGATQPAPEELHLLRESVIFHTVAVEPPTRWGETCNILYPRDVLERLGGFHEAFRQPAGEDMDLALRARRVGIPYLAAPEALTYHAVDRITLAERIRWGTRWRQAALVMKRNRRWRGGGPNPLGIFVRRSHALLLLAAVGGLATRRGPVVALLAVPWFVLTARQYRRYPDLRPRWRARVAARLVIEAADVVSLARGSIQYRSLVL